MTADLPPRLARMSRVPARLLSRGVPMGPLRLLRTTGRRSGLLRTAPVALLKFDGREWLVSPFGDTHWVHNVRADGRAELGRGRRFRRVRLTEVTGGREQAVLDAYRRKFRIVPFVRDTFDARPDAPRPVFLIDPPT
ncbi:nitroreductase family deazaflavin-dependent oxidoreductase [Actinomadura sp. B10D3]|uniref:nitroreductase family deazaflavin-dependent oxidoreductase n=1 Tax=Actinomadura sp. B10D3 TaxID=3153557 RepID=UPI00325E7BB1